MANIDKYLSDIRKDKFCKDMRETFCEALIEANKNAEETEEIVKNIKNEIAATNATAEVIDARKGKKTLGLRLDETEEKISVLDSQLEHIETEKASKIYVDTKVGNMGNTKTFKGSCLYSALPTSAEVDDYWYVTDKTTNYCWNGTSWVDIGNNLNIGDRTITTSKTTFATPVADSNFSVLYKNVEWLTKGQMYHTTTGNLVTTQYTTNFFPSQKIDCISEYEFTVGSKDGQVLFWKDETYLGFIDIGQKGVKFKALNGANKMAFNISNEIYKYDSVYRNTQNEEEYTNIKIEKLLLEQQNFPSGILNTLITGDTFIKYPYLTSTDDLNNVLTSGRYFSINAINQPKTGSFMLDVKEFKTTKENPKWVLQVAVENTTNIIYIRQIYNSVVDNWKKIQFETSLLKKVVNFGDSIFGNTNDSTSISSYLSNLLGTDCFNAGFGGCRMAERSDLQWNAFGMTALADAITTGDWTIQDTHISDSSLPSYFPGKLNLLKQINFATDVDIITIAYGTNDYVSTTTFDNIENKYDKTTVLGALRYSVKTILEKYPHVKILVISPIWRGFVGQDYTSDTKDFGTGTLIKYHEEMGKTCKELKVPFLNSYCECGINEFTKDYFFDSSDYTHPIAVGRKRYAEIIAGKIKTM